MNSNNVPKGDVKLFKYEPGQKVSKALKAAVQLAHEKPESVDHVYENLLYVDAEGFIVLAC
jgi:hypothetical protein